MHFFTHSIWFHYITISLWLIPPATHTKTMMKWIHLFWILQWTVPLMKQIFPFCIQNVMCCVLYETQWIYLSEQWQSQTIAPVYLHLCTYVLIANSACLYTGVRICAAHPLTSRAFLLLLSSLEMSRATLSTKSLGLFLLISNWLFFSL